MRFECVDGCAECCINREYYPEKKFGKIGVLILQKEKKRIKELARSMDIKIRILPRIGVSEDAEKPDRVLAWQLMGAQKDGSVCPFLDVASGKKSPHGGHPCMIYENRPLACMAYPVIESEPVSMDAKCKFCTECGSTDEGIEGELESLADIKQETGTDARHIWRYATGTGDKEDRSVIQTGWILMD